MYEYACPYELSYLISVITETSTHDLQVKKFAFHACFSETHTNRPPDPRV